MTFLRLTSKVVFWPLYRHARLCVHPTSLGHLQTATHTCCATFSFHVPVVPFPQLGVDPQEPLPLEPEPLASFCAENCSCCPRVQWPALLQLEDNISQHSLHPPALTWLYLLFHSIPRTL